MDFANRLEMLLEVSESGSFAKAAERLHMDRSVLSKQIKKLEETLGVRLLNRSTRSLALTSAGQDIVHQARKVRELLADTRNIADTYHNEPKGHLRISSATVFGRMYLQPAIEKFMAKYPQITIELILDDRRVDVIGERFDVVFRIGKLQDSNLVAKKIAPNDFSLLASREFVELHGNPETPEELISLPAIVYTNGSMTADQFQMPSWTNGDELASYEMNGKYFVNEAELMIEGMKAGIGYGLICDFMLPEPLNEMGLVKLLPYADIYTQSGIYAMYSHRNQPPLVKFFIEAVEEIIGSPPIWEQRFH
ncbi:LysR substrate-binding domain-containing protein [Vibrio coralliilyticus]|uniref:LysR family transcriptional regulator n=1 Tax=Vibrio coralliilyticus TaxID=190893 RepID=UPI0005129541|nr:LysR family transcriptional regulator [Vibrio coralliilyticus]AIU66690.1 LysR family transcriptional regulator [Vibrio coralliilyticus]